MTSFAARKFELVNDPISVFECDATTTAYDSSSEHGAHFSKKLVKELRQGRSDLCRERCAGKSSNIRRQGHRRSWVFWESDDFALVHQAVSRVQRSSVQMGILEP